MKESTDGSNTSLAWERLATIGSAHCRLLRDDEVGEEHEEEDDDEADFEVPLRPALDALPWLHFAAHLFYFYHCSLVYMCLYCYSSGTNWWIELFKVWGVRELHQAFLLFFLSFLLVYMGKREREERSCGSWLRPRCSLSCTRSYCSFCIHLIGRLSLHLRGAGQARYDLWVIKCADGGWLVSLDWVLIWQ